MKSCELNIKLEEVEAEALSQLLKRITLDDFRKLSANNDEAYSMKYACDILSKALKDAGFNPR